MQTNLLDNRIVRAVMQSRLYPAVFHAITAAVFILIVFQLLAGPAAAHHNFGTALTWVVYRLTALLPPAAKARALIGDVAYIQDLVPEVDVMLSSPYPRAWQTAELLHREAGWPAPQHCPELEAVRSPTGAGICDTMVSNSGLRSVPETARSMVAVPRRAQRADPR